MAMTDRARRAVRPNGVPAGGNIVAPAQPELSIFPSHP